MRLSAALEPRAISQSRVLGKGKLMAASSCARGSRVLPIQNRGGMSLVLNQGGGGRTGSYGSSVTSSVD
uniref:Uncharacterized protein n=1 Tax=Chromera velia CCMP2878 TaxID=1169474 RepID=A0A0G4HD81_9ALVE|eukprot:Cvel_26279.t1-p1 / transcript=Cvel_26279.t1 / gene=Cvel_26279 / organism=Chromera_velia_CCMP2878 / gene_product=hypothetical protein / transcript_product=hypothetical protein / location=Cvel_scaffold3102:20113-20316(-) / protein_length=68 / sequence_SO=supercontig / SO=protein_coding / is_pseudo=false